ncbi:GNAT family N-acetyltransferase [Paenibacillus silvisoli]|uniref:GNAT family N-acetyltransferase n=1 Tax=Paenibacillus silvisoli TaxID=3110539 RepID=UPI0028051FB7|nr:GNAT family N-acetyltransferase [Paenibacillus silvisoli]
MAVIIRAYEPGDIVRYAELFVDVFNREPWYDEWTLERAARYLNDFADTPGFKGIAAEQDGVIHGFIVGVTRRWWSGDEFYVHEMCVRPDEQRSGIGSHLMERLEQELRAEGTHNLALLTDRGTPAERFYKKNGFEEISRLAFVAKHTKS